ncbi:MAG: putative rane protein [Oscillospiraceae bacterium]|jgi:uncharacterized membrane protein YcaP (DUF421 family)|nr:putative rane protein [Oscillospiraceae bacterium]
MLIVFIRSILLYILIIFGLRVMGKRQIGELQPSELVITILISNMATLPIEDINIPMLMGAVPILALVGFEILLSNISLRNKKFREFVSGNPVVIIRDGIIDQTQMKKLRFSIDDLMETLRENSVFDVRDVYYAIVETTGQVSILQKYESQTVTTKMLDLKGSEQPIPIVVVSDGKIVEDSLEAYNLGKDWLLRTIQSNNVHVKDIYLMTADKNANYFIVPKSQK